MSVKDKKLDKKFFESEPRSALIRNSCLGALQAAQKMIDSDGQDKLAEAELMEANRHLTELGIKPGMHVITATDPETTTKERMKIKTDPLIAVEYLAGQLRNLIIDTGVMGSTDGLAAQLSEHDELVGEIPGLAIIRGGRLSVACDIGIVGMLSSMIDYDAGPSELALLK